MESKEVFKFKKSNRKNIRKRKAEKSDDSSSEDETTVQHKVKKSGHGNYMVQSTQGAGKQKEKIEVSDSDSDEKFMVSYKSDKRATPAGPSDMGATSTLQTETEKQKDSRSILERSQKINEELKGKEDDKIYRGINNYTKFGGKSEDAAGNALTFRKGPIRAPDHIRSTVRWDYQPDICKDYKETGFCGFGDSCKFMHDRSDYKHGWQLELEMNNKTYGCDDSTKYEISSDEEDLPFRCFICRSSFKSPVVTKCKHYFCEKCALDHHRKSPKCFICGQQTMGLFNNAKKLEQKLEASKSTDIPDT